MTDVAIKDQSQWPPIVEIAARVRGGELKAVDLVEKALATIEAKADYEAIIATTADRARERAKLIDERVGKGEEKGALASTLR